MLTIEKVHEITNELEKRASLQLNLEITKAQNYHDGYVQACEDFGKWVRAELYCNGKEKTE